MKIWTVEIKILSWYSDYEPSSSWSMTEKVFDSKDKAVSYVRERIKDVIADPKDYPDDYVDYIIDHIPSDEELLHWAGCYYKCIVNIETSQYHYIIHEYDVE